MGKIIKQAVLTSICHIKLDSKVSTGASRVVASCEDDPTDGLDLPDDAGNSGGGQEAVVADNQTTNLQSTDYKEKQSQMSPNVMLSGDHSVLLLPQMFHKCWLICLENCPSKVEFIFLH